MKKKITMILILIIAILTAGCSVKQNQLVILQKHTNAERNIDDSLTLNFNTLPQKISIENNAELLKKIDPEVIPLAVSSDTGVVIGFSFIDSKEADETNSRIVIGNMIQPINLYAVDTNENEKELLGKFLSPKDFQFDETGNLFAFIDGGSNIYIYDTQAKQLQKIIEGKNYYAYESLSWSRDSKKLLINQRMTLDISSKQLISYAVEAYNPFVEQKYNNQEIYIVQMKNNEYNDMIALYNYDSRSFKNLASGVFLDSDNINLIYTKQSQSDLFVLNMETLESKSIATGPIYTAKIMKSTGDILYTTVNPDLTSINRYQLIKFNPNNGSKKTIALTTPTFYLSPAENKLFFVGDYNANRMTADTTLLNLSKPGGEESDTNLLNIKTVILKMFQLDYNFTGTYEEYEKLASKIYTNTYSPVSQEALENKLIDFKRFNMPLPTWQKEPTIPPTIVMNTVNIQNESASVNLGFFFINSIEFAKVEDSWMITGFSTHPASKEIKEIRAIVQKHINDIKSKNKEEAMKYWKNEEMNEFDKNQLLIVEDLIKNSASYNFEIGEIELWSKSEPHRAESAQNALDAKVKVIINNKTNTQKYKLVLSKENRRSFTIESWSIDPLSISQLQ